MTLKSVGAECWRASISEYGLSQEAAFSRSLREKLPRNRCAAQAVNERCVTSDSSETLMLWIRTLPRREETYPKRNSVCRKHPLF
jgi:hypothetical protein